MEKKKENYTMHDLCKAVGFRTGEIADIIFIEKKENIMVSSIRFCTNIDLVRTRRR